MGGAWRDWEKPHGGSTGSSPNVVYTIYIYIYINTPSMWPVCFLWWCSGKRWRVRSPSKVEGLADHLLLLLFFFFFDWISAQRGPIIIINIISLIIISRPKKKNLKENIKWEELLERKTKQKKKRKEKRFRPWTPPRFKGVCVDWSFLSVSLAIHDPNNNNNKRV